MHTLNLGVLAHIDAGKTSLTERLLFRAGVIDHLGRVDDGTTQTDTLALERQRGITIKSAVASFAVDDVTVNLIDTPGHPDFIAEVERALAALDAVILVISAVEGVQAQTRVLMRALRRLRLPVVIFVNKIDRAGADPDRVVEEIRRRLAPSVIAMGAVDRPGQRVRASFHPFRADDARFTECLLEVLAEHDDQLLAAFVNGGRPDDLVQRLAYQVRAATICPIYFGSAVTGAGVEELIEGIVTVIHGAESLTNGPAAGVVFKIERSPAGEKIAYVRMYAGAVAVRDRLRLGHRSPDRARRGDKITAMEVFDRGPATATDHLEAGQIGKLWGLAGARIGDRFGDPGGREPGHLAVPPLETVVTPEDPADRPALFSALTRLTEQDPLIDLRTDDVRQTMSLSLYGEVQKEVIQATLAAEYELAVRFEPTTAVCIERPLGTGAAVEFMPDEDNPFLATVGLRIEPAPAGSGVRFEVAGEVLGTMPVAFYRAIEDTVRGTLSQGLRGWQVTDCMVTLTHTGYAPRQSHAHASFDKTMSSTGADFRGLTPLVLMSALGRAGTVVCEPVHRFDLDVPADAVGAVLGALSSVGGMPETTEVSGERAYLGGTIPAGQVHRLQRLLPGITRGEGDLSTGFDSYQPVRGQPPYRPRMGADPLDRRAYLIALGIRH